MSLLAGKGWVVYAFLIFKFFLIPSQRMVLQNIQLLGSSNMQSPFQMKN